MQLQMTCPRVAFPLYYTVRHRSHATPIKGRGGVGIALYPAHGTDEETLPHHADVAMYAAKRAGGGHVLYNVTREHDPPGD